MKFGDRSLKNLHTCHTDLQKIFYLAIKISRVDFGISEGHRSLERQRELYQQGKSKINGTTKKGKHNIHPSMAADIYAYHPDINVRRKIIYDIPTLSYLAGTITAIAKELKEKGEITHDIRWGGNWNKDGVILHDQSFDDLPHYELI